MRATTLVLLCLLLLTPPASATFWRDVEIEVPAHRLGTAMRYDQAYLFEGEERTGTFLVQAMVFGVQRDAYGVERDVVTYQGQSEEGGEPVWAAQCHLLAGGSDVVRMDTLLGAYSSGWDNAWSSDVAGIQVGSAATSMETTYTTSFSNSCEVPFLAPTTYREGQTLWLDELLRGGAHASAIAAATKFEGRHALTARFDIGGGNVTATLADGLPGIVAMRFESGEEWGHSTLVGFREGDGELVPARGEAALPPRNPDAAFAAARALGPDLSALPLAYPLHEAIANLRADADAGLEAWLRAHPDAMLVGAYYDREGRNTPVDGDAFETHGGWGLTFGDDDTWRYWYSSRSTVGMGVGAMLPGATQGVQNFAFDEQTITAGSGYSFDIGPYEEAHVGSLLAIMAAEGLAAKDVQAVEYYRYELKDGPMAHLRLSDVSFAADRTDEGTLLGMDMRKGGLHVMGERRVEAERTGLLALSPGGVEASGTRAAAGALLSGPASGLGIAAATATGIGLLVLMLKLLFPLYSRLRQDRLLDNQIRARLYERVRREPGIHRAELVDYAGIGEGATRHHLGQLVRHRLLVETNVDGYARYFAAGEVPPAVARREAVLRAGSHREVYDLFAAEPDLSLREAAARLGMSAPSVHRAKKKLAQAGLLPAAPAAQVAEA